MRLAHRWILLCWGTIERYINWVSCTTYSSTIARKWIIPYDERELMRLSKRPSICRRVWHYFWRVLWVAFLIMTFVTRCRAVTEANWVHSSEAFNFLLLYSVLFTTSLLVRIVSWDLGLIVSKRAQDVIRRSTFTSDDHKTARAPSFSPSWPDYLTITFSFYIGWRRPPLGLKTWQ